MAAAGIAEKYLKLAYGIEIVAFVSSVGRVCMPFIKAEEGKGVKAKAILEDFYTLLNKVTRSDVDADVVRCPEPTCCEEMHKVS